MISLNLNDNHNKNFRNSNKTDEYTTTRTTNMSISQLFPIKPNKAQLSIKQHKPYVLENIDKIINSKDDDLLKDDNNIEIKHDHYKEQKFGGNIKKLPELDFHNAGRPNLDAILLYSEKHNQNYSRINANKEIKNFMRVKQQNSKSTHNTMSSPEKHEEIIRNIKSQELNCKKPFLNVKINQLNLQPQISDDQLTNAFETRNKKFYSPKFRLETFNKEFDHKLLPQLEIVSPNNNSTKIKDIDTLPGGFYPAHSTKRNKFSISIKSSENLVKSPSGLWSKTPKALSNPSSNPSDLNSNRGKPTLKSINSQKNLSSNEYSNEKYNIPQIRHTSSNPRKNPHLQTNSTLLSNHRKVFMGISVVDYDRTKKIKSIKKKNFFDIEAPLVSGVILPHTYNFETLNMYKSINKNTLDNPSRFNHTGPFMKDSTNSNCINTVTDLLYQVARAHSNEHRSFVDTKELLSPMIIHDNNNILEELSDDRNYSHPRKQEDMLSTRLNREYLKKALIDSVNKNKLKSVNQTKISYEKKRSHSTLIDLGESKNLLGRVESTGKLHPDDTNNILTNSNYNNSSFGPWDNT